jgi:Leucine-rich repeat (LRR) protein
MQPIKLINFPSVTVGKLFVSRSKSLIRGWRFYGEAQGLVAVPAECSVKLEPSLDGMERYRMDWVFGLQPDDIYEIDFRGGRSPYRMSLTNEEIRGLQRLSGLTVLFLPEMPLDSEGMRSLAGIRDLSALQIRSAELTTETAGCLRYFSKLRLLSIFCKSIAENAYKHISEMGNLESLSLGSAPIRYIDLQLVSRCRKLRHLSFGFQSVEWQSCSTIGDMGQIQELEMQYCFLAEGAARELLKNKNLRVLNLSTTTGVTDGELGGLAALKWLTDLRIDDTEVSDMSSAVFSNFPRLAAIDLSGTNIGNRTVAMICEHSRKLRTMDLSLTKFTDEGLASLVKLDRLLHLDINRCLVDDTSCKILRTLHLDHLSLIGCPITDTGARDLCRMRSLTSLDISETSVERISRVPLNGLPKLKQLDVCGLPVDDTDIDYLAHLPSLRFVDIDRTKITSAGVARLEKNKRLTVTWSDPTKIESSDVTANQVSPYRCFISRKVIQNTAINKAEER